MRRTPSVISAMASFTILEFNSSVAIPLALITGLIIIFPLSTHPAVSEGTGVGVTVGTDADGNDGGADDPPSIGFPGSGKAAITITVADAVKPPSSEVAVTTALPAATAVTLPF
ncbi:hypothetical protein D3C77_475380 [compost metagenome]